MAGTYHLICVDCRAYLSLGKVHWQSESGEALDEVTIDGVFDPVERVWHRRDELFGRTVEGFLIRHRNHELRFVPEGVDEILEDGGDVFTPLDPQDVLWPTVECKVDPEREMAEWRRRRATLASLLAKYTMTVEDAFESESAATEGRSKE